MKKTINIFNSYIFYIIFFYNFFILWLKNIKIIINKNKKTDRDNLDNIYISQIKQKKINYLFFHMIIRKNNMILKNILIMLMMKICKNIYQMLNINNIIKY